MEKGLTEEKVARLAEYHSDAIFTDRERLALEFAEKMAMDHTALGDEFFRRLRVEFSDAEVVELGMAIGQYLGFGRFLHALEVVRPVCDI